MIKLENLSKTFVKDGNKIEVLKGLNLEIARGDSLAVVGVSGAGKSTLIHILGTLDHPTGGSLSIAGQAVFNWNEKKIAAFRNRTIGFVFQFNNLLPEFTALENAMMPAFIGGLERKKALDRAAHLLTEVGLEHRLRHKPGELSGGEQQRVAIARALINDPDIILADEPTGNLDAAAAQGIIDILKDVRLKQGKTLIMVTHDQQLAEQADRVIRLAVE